MRRILAVLLVLLMAFCLIACGTQKDTTMTGMVTSIDGTVISLVEMDGDMGGILKRAKDLRCPPAKTAA